jgi:hypothetical protein
VRVGETCSESPSYKFRSRNELSDPLNRCRCWHEDCPVACQLVLSKLALPVTISDAMHVLVLDHNHTNGLAQALQLSSYGLTVEAVPDVEEAARRLSAMAFDAVLYNVPDVAQHVRLQTFQEIYPDTEFFTTDRIEDFLKQIRKDTSVK